MPVLVLVLVPGLIMVALVVDAVLALAVLALALARAFSMIVQVPSWIYLASTASLANFNAPPRPQSASV